MDKPTQDEIDSIGSYVQAIDELEGEPFFSKDEPRKLSSGGKHRSFHLGDRFHFRSALITFRRIWMTGDAENIDRVCGILRRFLHPAAWELAKDFRHNIKEQLKSTQQWLGVGNITGEKLIDLWMHTVFAHSGLRGPGQSRHDFDNFVEQFGQGPMEYAFRHIVWAIGIEYRNIGKFARGLLTEWKESGLIPSFVVRPAFGSKRREQLQPNPALLVVAVLKYNSFAELARTGEMEFKIAESLPKEMSFAGDIQSYTGLMSLALGLQSSFQCTGVEAYTDFVGVQILDELLANFKKELLAG